MRAVTFFSDKTFESTAFMPQDESLVEHGDSGSGVVCSRGNQNYIVAMAASKLTDSQMVGLPAHKDFLDGLKAMSYEQLIEKSKTINMSRISWDAFEKMETAAKLTDKLHFACAENIPCFWK